MPSRLGARPALPAHSPCAASEQRTRSEGERGGRGEGAVGRASTVAAIGKACWHCGVAGGSHCRGQIGKERRRR